MLLDSIKDIVKKHNKIGIFVSGGLDSGFMLYLFHKFKLELGTDNQFKIYTVERPNQSMMFAQRMVDYINREFGSNHTINKVGTDQLHHSLHIASGIIEAGNDDTEVFVLADTLIPGEVPNGPKRRLINHPKVRQPWLFLAKDEIVQNCIDLELMDLMTISHSCETTNMIPCRICWHCKERNWAFWKCGYPDPLTIMSTDNLSY
jgi:hypothetical protein